jgi:hypothetical protein
MRTAKRTAERGNVCRAIEHYTDAVAEGSVAAVQAEQAGDDALAKDADQLVRRATHQQRAVVRACRRKR